ncbi:methionyl-tRNA formyltransferase [Paenisporosarcina cavernae]|uniref:Methionyl-tRNA formyltransferase n=1 Tax=Paenisporosarcina cavernae TaxID=2320858 RepID=A0A385YRS0_9BACL|nr:methionyl-tRNA formyltransferase [Paenisporosarcina cavernae]AYC29194.1 methionyl-tRNA formyltransferase [Paenisporosarcina cavernae]
MTSIIFMGTPSFSVPILNRLVEEGYQITHVVTQPDRPFGRKKVLTAPPVKEAALLHGIPVLQPEKLRGSKEERQIIDAKPDLIITAAFGQLLPKDILDTPSLGCINVHASLLPLYRGGAPIHQAVMDGQEKTGVTIMYMAEKLDAGDIISQDSLPILEEDTTGSMFEKLSTLGADLLLQTLPSILTKTNARTKQNELEVTYARNISRDQERINWSSSSRDIFNQIRGLNPWPGAYTTKEEVPVKIWASELSSKSSTLQVGCIVEVEKDRIIVQTGNSETIAITELQPSGKKKMSAEAYLAGVGAKLSIGDKFE